MKIVEEAQKDICVNDMKDGEIGVITKWEVEENETRFVQRYKDIIISLGKDSGATYDMILQNTHLANKNCRVRILPPGTKIEI